MRKSLLLALFLLLAALAVHAQEEKPVPPQPVPEPIMLPTPTPEPTPTPTPTPVPRKANERPPAKANGPAEPFDRATIAEMAAKCVRLETEAGVIELEMLPESAPETVRHFLNLVASGALDTTTFNRVVPGFVIQGGNLSTRQTMTPEIAARAKETIMDEPNLVLHIRGVVSMARPDEPNGATTNFFILVSEAAHLNGTFAAFARVTKGMDVVDKINHGEVDGEKPVKPVRLTRATLVTCSKPEPEKPAPVPPEE
jgi:peptidyl-prolyl cis-trans isomerase B (cyclophilin B)